MLVATRRAPRADPGAVPDELLDVAAPIWWDIKALERHPVFGPLVDGAVRSRARLGVSTLAPVTSRWLRAAGHVTVKGWLDWSVITHARGGLGGG